MGFDYEWEKPEIRVSKRGIEEIGALCKGIWKEQKRSLYEQPRDQ